MQFKIDLENFFSTFITLGKLDSNAFDSKGLFLDCEWKQLLWVLNLWIQFLLLTHAVIEPKTLDIELKMSKYGIQVHQAKS